MAPDEVDPKGLIAQSFEIEGIGLAECRSIFLDWAMSLPPTTPPDRAARRLIERHRGEPADHPMHDVLREAVAPPAARRPVRRGGWKGRRSDG